MLIQVLKDPKYYDVAAQQNKMNQFHSLNVNFREIKMSRSVVIPGVRCILRGHADGTDMVPFMLLTQTTTEGMGHSGGDHSDLNALTTSVEITFLE